MPDSTSIWNPFNYCPETPMPRSLDDILASLPAKRRERIELAAMELATLYQLRRAARCTQQEVADTLGVGQHTISRLERRGDMLLSTIRHYVESLGGTLHLVAEFPNRAPVRITHLAAPPVTRKKTPSSARPRRPRSS